MFGYILPEKPELKIKEYELFRAYYCGVCKSIARNSGQMPRLLLNYDSAFLALLLSSLAGESPEISRERCAVHPLRARNVVKNSGIVSYASDINILLAYYNLKDKWKDDRSLLSAAGMLALKRCVKKLKKRHGEKCAIIESRLKELAQLEADRCSSMDMAAEPFAKLMEEVMAYEPLCKSDKNRETLKWLGYNLGKWIYILDAYNDIEDDIRKKAYNVLLCQFNYSGGDIGAFKESIRERVEFTLTYALNQIAKAYELMEIKANSAIVENIIYMGMLRKTENILGTGSCSKVEKSV